MQGKEKIGIPLLTFFNQWFNGNNRMSSKYSSSNNFTTTIAEFVGLT